MGDEKLQARMNEILDTLAETPAGSELYDALVKEYKMLSEAAIESFKAESDDVNNNNRNEVEKVKSRNDMIAKLGVSAIGAFVTLRLSKLIGQVEEVGAVTTKILGFIPKWKF